MVVREDDMQKLNGEPPDDMIVGQITKAYNGEGYFRIFITPDEILITKYSSLPIGSSSILVSITSITLSVYRTKRDKNLLDKIVTKEMILAEFPGTKIIEKDMIVECRLKKGMTDGFLYLEFPPKKLFLNFKEKDIVRYGFSKKEYDDVMMLMSDYYGDKLKIL